MADYFVASGGSNTAPYDTWAKAATSLATAINAASTSGDRVIIQYNGVPSGDAELSSDTTYTLALISGGTISIIASTNSGTATVTPTAMGTGNWIGNSTTNRSITLSASAGQDCYIYGLTFRTSGSTSDNITIGLVTAAQAILDSCYLWQGNTGVTTIIIGAASTSRTNIRLINCTFRFGATGQSLNCRNRTEFIGCTISGSGSTPTTLINSSSVGALTTFIGCDLSLITGTLVAAPTSGSKNFEFIQCKLGDGVTILAAQGSSSEGTEVIVIDCDSGDNHYQFAHYSCTGALTVDTGIYANDGAAYVSTPTRYSWKIVTTSNASYTNPYVSPWISVHHEGTSAITPNLECVRSGSATAYKDDEVWAEFLYKGTSGFTTGTVDSTDKRALTGTAANQTTGALGAGDWTGENGTAWFGKLAPASAITPAEIGDLCARVCVGKASDTVYVDPQIRGRS